jgi:hypothetical protein
MSVHLKIDSWDDLARAIGTLQQHAPHRVPLLSALFRGEIAHLELQRSGPHTLFEQWTALARLPSIALIGDDDQVKPDGPDAWPIAERLFRWSRFNIIHGTGSAVWHYGQAVTIAARYGRVAMVECSSENLAAWVAAAERWGNGVRGLIIKPPSGQAHPEPGRRWTN